MKCFYHNDADGKCAAFWVTHDVRVHDIYPYYSVEMNHAKPFPIESIQPGEQIYIVDYFISPDEMRQLFEITKDVTWIDHHKTASEEYEDFEHDIRGIRYDGIAGCMLAYCYIRHMTDRGEGNIKPFVISMTKEAPLFTKLIADWDVWKFDFGDDTRNFMTAFNAYDFEPEGTDWDMFCTQSGWDIEDGGLVQQGKTMSRFVDGWAKEYMKLGFETVFEGVKCFAVNLGHCNSDYFKSLPAGNYEVFMPFIFDGNQFIVSMYSTTIDVSAIAKKYGGGGHKGSSGFQCYNLPFYKIG